MLALAAAIAMVGDFPKGLPGVILTRGETLMA